MQISMVEHVFITSGDPRLPRTNLISPLFSGAITFFPGQLPHFLVRAGTPKSSSYEDDQNSISARPHLFSGRH